MMSRVLPVLFVLIAGALFFGYINPTVTGSVAETNKQIKQYDAALTAAKRFEQKQTQLALEQKALPADGVARLKAYLPDGVDNVQLILDLDGLAARSGIKILNFNTTESKKQTAVTQPGGQAPTTATAPMSGTTGATVDTSKPYDSLDLSITASGTYPELRSFLASIETSLRPLDLVEFQLADSSTGVYTYQMTFRLYWLR
jgi:hypothetical protein